MQILIVVGVFYIHYMISITKRLPGAGSLANGMIFRQVIQCDTFRRNDYRHDIHLNFKLLVNMHKEIILKTTFNTTYLAGYTLIRHLALL